METILNIDAIRHFCRTTRCTGHGFLSGFRRLFTAAMLSGSSRLCCRWSATPVNSVVRLTLFLKKGTNPNEEMA